MPQPITLGITGRIGAGKTSAGEYFVSAYGFQYVRYSEVLADWMGKGEPNKVHLQRIGWDVMAGGMQAELNRRLIARIDHNRDCSVDGLRHPIDYDSLANVFASRFHLLYIDCPPDIRWQHLRHKRRYASYEEFLKADSHPVEQQIELLRPDAYAVVPNKGTLSDFQLQLDAILKRIRTGDRK